MKEDLPKLHVEYSSKLYCDCRVKLDANVPFNDYSEVDADDDVYCDEDFKQQHDADDDDDDDDEE